MDDATPDLRIALAVAGGSIVAIVGVLTALMFSAGEGQDAAITDTTPTTGTIAAPTTTATTLPPTTTTVTTTITTTVPPTTTTLAAPTTTTGPTDPSGFDTAPKTAAATGTPGSALTDLRLGDHVTFNRIVFDFVGDGTPAYEVAYESGPTFAASESGTEVTPAGSAFLVVRVTPGLIAAGSSPTYSGPTSFDPDLGPIVEISFVDDFEAEMVWVIGLSGEHGFVVSTRLDPQRLVIDIAN